MMSAHKLSMIGAGIFTIFCSFMDYDWFLNHSKAKPLVAILGRDGTRVFYTIIGIAIIFLSLVFL